MKVLLLQPPNNLDGLLGAGKIFVEPMEPLGLLYIASYLERLGHSVEILDFFSMGESMEIVKEALQRKSFDVIGISCLTSNAVVVHHMGKWIKERFPSAKVVLGNIHASVFHEYYLKTNAADFVVHGEGEETFAELLETMDRFEDLAGVRGISFLRGTEVVKTEPRPRIKDLDAIPHPARHLLDRSTYAFKYNPMTSEVKGKRYAPILTSRGCVNKCSFCAVSMGRRYSKRSAENVLEEIKLLIDQYGVNYIMTMDSLLTVDRQRVIDICNLIIEEKLNIEWSCEGHVNFLDDEMLRSLRKAGCVEISLGIESGDQVLLDRIRKGTQIKDIIDTVNMVKRNGIRTAGLFMLGLPGETPKQTRKTISFACSLNLDSAQFSVLTPYPGTDLYYELLQNGEIDIREDRYMEDWLRFVAYPCFTDMKPIWTTKGRSYQELSDYQKKAIRKFYLRPRQLLPRLKMLNHKNIIPNLKAFFSLYKSA